MAWEWTMYMRSAAKELSSDNWPAAELNFKAEQKRLDFTLQSYNRINVTLYKNYMIFIQLP